MPLFKFVFIDRNEITDYECYLTSLIFIDYSWDSLPLQVSVIEILNCGIMGVNYNDVSQNLYTLVVGSQSMIIFWVSRVGRAKNFFEAVVMLLVNIFTVSTFG